jgi:hypothetical protein
MNVLESTSAMYKRSRLEATPLDESTLNENPQVHISNVQEESLRSDSSGLREINKKHCTSIPLAGHRDDVQVVCNWNDSTPALLRQLALAKMKTPRGSHTLGEPVVVLADRPKHKMDMDVEQEVRASCNSYKCNDRKRSASSGQWIDSS